MMRMTTPRPRRHARSLTVRAVFIAAVFSLTALYQYYNTASASSSSRADDSRQADLDSTWFRGEQKKLEEIDPKEDLNPDTEEYADNRPVAQAQNHLQIQDGDGPGAAGRKLLLVVPPAAIRPFNDTGDNSTGEPPHVNDNNHTSICTPPAYHEFPTDAFTAEQRKNGAIILHFIMVIYMFTALAVVCDIYFVASLEKICYKLDLSADVAGATFMAAGSSAPELFTSIIGVFIAKGDVGVGTIVGSAVFNILFVVGICGVLVSEAVPLTWYPLMRDSFFYVLSVIMLIASIADTQVTWYEATIMLILYVFYILVMKFNPIIQAWITPRVHLFTHAVAEDASKIITGAEKGKFYGGNNYEMFSNEPAEHTGGYQSGAPPTTGNGPRPMGPGGHGTSKVIPVDDYVLKSTRKVSFEDACFRFMKMRGFRPKTRFRSAVLIIMCERRKLLRDPVFMRREQQAMYVYGSVPDSYSNINKQNIDLVEDPEPANQWRRIPSAEEGYIARVKWAFLLPINILLYYTVPECNLPRWDSWFMVTFGMSIVWIAAFSYVMVWMVVLIGFTLGIPDSIMGITFLAAGTSVPDAMASVMVARQGQGDMAVSNTIGSNVFDVLIGLALPWFLMTACVNPGSAVHINSNGMVFSVILLFLTVIITVMAIQIGGWKLDKKLGVICLSCYAVFLTFSIMIEFNVFGYVNAPMCTE